MLDNIADGVFVTHGVFMVLAIPSTLLALVGFYRSRMYLFHFHNFCMAVMVAGRITLGKCPLVTVEEGFRSWAGTQMAYQGSFVEHVMMQIGIDMPKSSVLYISVLVAVFTAVAGLRHLGYLMRQEGETELMPEHVAVSYQ